MAGMLALSELLVDAVLRLLPRFSVRLLASPCTGELFVPSRSWPDVRF